MVEGKCTSKSKTKTVDLRKLFVLCTWTKFRGKLPACKQAASYIYSWSIGIWQSLTSEKVMMQTWRKRIAFI